MKKTLMFIPVFIFVISSCVKLEEVEGPAISHGRIEEVEIPFTDDPMVGLKRALVYLPPGYDSTDTSTLYPLIFLLHGFGWDYTFFQAVEDIADIVDYLISTQEMQKCVIVMPDGKNALGGSFYTDSDFGQFETYITDVVYNYMKENYLVDTTRVGIAGISMGGYGALKLAIKHLDMFKAAAAHSGPLCFELMKQPDPETGLNLMGMVLLENPVIDSATGDTVDYRIPYPPNLDEEHPLTTMLFAMAGAFSSVVKDFNDFDIANYEFPLIDLGNGQWIGVILPFDTTAHPGDTVGIRDSVWAEWLEHDVATLVMQNSSQIDSAGLAIYFDCGDADEYMLYYHAQYLHELMNQLGIEHTYEEFSSGPVYPAERFPARHATHLYFRLKESLKFLSDNL